nr:glutathione S-transferase [Saccharina japonica]
MNKPTAGARTVKELQRGDHPIQLYSLATPNGQKVTVALEEMGLKYDAWYTDIMAGDQFTSGFVEINPNSKIPALVHRDAPGGKPLHLFETGNILLYLAELTGKFLPTDPAKKAECLNWLFFNIGEALFGLVRSYCHVGQRRIGEDRLRCDQNLTHRRILRVQRPRSCWCNPYASLYQVFPVAYTHSGFPNDNTACFFFVSLAVAAGGG